jgi:hypothetical protein
MTGAEAVAGRVLGVVGVYLAIGTVATAAIQWRGLSRIDPATRGSGAVFRLLVTPGLLALWPLALLSWRRAVRGEVPSGRADSPVSPQALRSAHRWAWGILAVLVPATLLYLVALRPAQVRPTTLPHPALPDAR